MGLLMNIFTWWNGATYGTRIFSSRNGAKVGTDTLGNVYFESKKPIDGRTRRWVIYSGANDASRVPPEWHGWLHNTTDLIPDDLPPARVWEKPPVPNLTGRVDAYVPAGAIARGGHRAAATGDYEAWSPN
ncbi:NADH:ubiquinone oxidoreductase subunit NDUFA12 [Sphingomonas naphthae]|uniref:NADH:ubiquinone oxidoreductase subunit NDUFA12 n=1 Tax=Sphingomonas naphthae TaxID=1813468 RepID=A0ABY7TKU1_9SPHN|nr:NADH:ubiquinone oxidoreductase subunit NDUFA12 [Sphingomonas naphthae]WCT73406.1 NADH:ubiquinone oxidoreductase subunit NDUFA12 [Sphingomonas naphthae]